MLFYHEEKGQDTTKGTIRKGAKQAHQIGFEQANPKENEKQLPPFDAKQKECLHFDTKQKECLHIVRLRKKDPNGKH